MIVKRKGTGFFPGKEKKTLCTQRYLERLRSREQVNNVEPHLRWAVYHDGTKNREQQVEPPRSKIISRSHSLTRLANGSSIIGPKLVSLEVGQCRMEAAQVILQGLYPVPHKSQI